MDVIQITDGDFRQSAIKVPSLPDNPDDLAEIVAILRGRHDLSGRLLREVIPGSAAEALGARRFTILAFDEAPPGGFGIGGVYGVMNWVANRLDPAMPDGWGAAHSEPLMWSLIGNPEGTEYSVTREPFARRTAEENGLSFAFCVAISPMDRAVTRAVAAHLRDFDAPPGTPTVLPVTV